MTNRPTLKLITIVVTGIILIFLILVLYFGLRVYRSIFRLSQSQVSGYLIGTKSECNKLASCKLLPGDILIRRYITPRTQVFDKFAHPYFTHSAFYLGNDQLVEAVGTEKNSKDDIQIDIFSDSDWLNPDMNNFVIIRPKHYSSKLEIIENNLKNIANDPGYIFGLPIQGRKRTTCADLIFRQLIEENVITVSGQPQIITPDYLFWLAINNPIDFEIIGYGK